MFCDSKLIYVNHIIRSLFSKHNKIKLINKLTKQSKFIFVNLYQVILLI